MVVPAKQRLSDQVSGSAPKHDSADHREDCQTYPAVNSSAKDESRSGGNPQSGERLVVDVLG
jgi:hypothetical protein